MVYQMIHTYSPTYQQGIYDLAHMVQDEERTIRTTTRQMVYLQLVSDCLLYGWHQAIAGKAVSSVTLPPKLNRAEKLVCVKAICVGIQVAVKQLERQSHAA